MDEYALKRIIFLPTQDFCTLSDLFTRQLEKVNIESIISDEIEFIHWKNERNTLYITANPIIAKKLSDSDIPVLGCLTEQNKDLSFGKTKFLITSLEEIEPYYLERVYRRCVGLPWSILQTERCLVRETTENDLDAFYEIYRDREIYRYTENLYAEKEKELQYIKDYRKAVYEFYEFGVWTIELLSTGEIIGRAGLSMREGFEDPELGFVIGKKWQKKGIAFEVCEAILKYGLEELHFNKILAFTDSENAASVCLLKKLGFFNKGNIIIQNVVSNEKAKVDQYELCRV